jgi:hypothetical protein
MQPIIKSLTWEYFARNRWMLLFPILANLPGCLILLPLMGISDIDSFTASRELVAIYLILFLCLVLIVGFGVLVTQGSHRRLYLLPISTLKIASFYYWTGALLVAVQVAAMLWLWNALLPIDWPIEWPIAGPVLFAVVCWGALQPVVRGVSHSLWWIVATLAIVSGLFYWFLLRHGIQPKPGAMMSPDIHYWSMISLADVAIAATILSISYALTILRVHLDRSGRRQLSLLERIESASERVQTRFASGSRQFRSPMQSLAWFNFRAGNIVIPMISIFMVTFVWLFAVIGSSISRDATLLSAIPIAGTNLAGMLLVLMTLLWAAISRMEQSLSPYKAPDHDRKKINGTPFGISQFLYTLPISSTDMARAILRSSSLACGVASAVLLLSFALAGALGWLLGTDLVTTMGLKFSFWKYVLAIVSFSLMMSFVFSNSAISVVPSLLRIDHWIWPILVMAALLAFRLPLGLCLSAGLCVFALVALVYSTIRSVIDRDASVGTASLIWLVGIAFAVGLMALLRSELGPVGMLLTGSLVGLVMLPFFSTAAGLRRARTT